VVARTTALKRTLHRWWLIAYVGFTMSLAAWRYVRRSRRRHRMIRHVDAWPW
jgi:hypothetical protein